jgi:TatD DNase family protein
VETNWVCAGTLVKASRPKRRFLHADPTAERIVIDTHCHLDMPEFDPDRAAVIARAARAGVDAILVPAVRPRSFEALTALRDRTSSPALLLALGVHPQVVADLDDDERRLALDPEALATVTRDAGAVAIGECGLDGGSGDQEGQEAVFRAHIRAARALGCPLIIHVLRAHGAAPRILAEERVVDVGGVLHSYSGGADLVPTYRALGLSFSFAGPITYPNARRPIAAARVVPADRVLAETDAPDQAPQPYRGQRSEPAFVKQVIAGLAAARGVSPAEMEALTTANARRLFRL